MEKPLLAPLVVGVTGHRDLRQEDLPELRNAVGRVLDEQRPAATPLMLLSPLAEGADRLVAWEALQRGARLVAILPMDRDLYEKDFKTEESLREFHELLSKAETIITLPVSKREEVEKEGDARNLQYALVGAVVARHSDLLLALWDGKPEAGTGGTAQIVQFQSTGRFETEKLQQAFRLLEEPFGPGSDPLAAPEPGLVIRILTPREKSPILDQPFHTSELVPDVKQPKAFSDAVEATRERLNAFNEDLNWLWRTNPPSDGNVLCSEADASQLPKALQELRRQFAGADALAIFYQGRTKVAIRALSILVFLAAASFAYHSTLAPAEARRNPSTLAMYLILLALAGCVHLLAEYLRVHSKFLDYRAVAEGLRVQFFWSLGGLKKSVANHYLRWQRSELEWIRYVLRPWSLALAVAGPLPASAGRLVCECWIKDQADFFQKREPAKRHLLLRLTSTRNSLLVSSIVVAAFEIFAQPDTWHPVRQLMQAATALACLFLVWKLTELRHEPELRTTLRVIALGMRDAFFVLLVLGAVLLALWYSLKVSKQLDPRYFESWPDAWRMVLMGLSAVAAGLIYGYAEVMALSDESKQYARMVKIFGSALQQPSRPELLEALGKEALAENGEWVLMHREKPVELPYA